VIPSLGTYGWTCLTHRLWIAVSHIASCPDFCTLAHPRLLFHYVNKYSRSNSIFAQESQLTIHRTMLTNVKKVPPLGRSAKRLQRPYLKADITIEDQQREQKKLLNAGKAFSAYSRLNLDIIAISYEHKCFSEAKNKVPHNPVRASHKS